MSLDGQGQLISRQINGGSIRYLYGSCGGHWPASLRGPFVRCTLGHTHCTRCNNQARRFRKGWSCNCKVRGE